MLLSDQPMIRSTYDLEKAIKTYNTRYEAIWDFSTLHELFQQHMHPGEVEEFFDVVLPRIIFQALKLPEYIQCPVPLLKQSQNRSISMSQQQASCLMANAFLCTYPRRNTDKKNSEFSTYPEINFNRLYGCRGPSIIQKLKCIINYFKRTLCGEFDDQANVITFQRISKSGFSWELSETSLDAVKYHLSSTGKIEDGHGMLQVDFANKFVGGGVLGNGCVQEEIRFLINPEMIVAKLFTEFLLPDEALSMIGCEQFNSYSGYAGTFQFAGNFDDQTPVDAYRRRKSRVVAIDALSYNDSFTQFKEDTIRRELNKAYTGFYGPDGTPVATGLWGCGAFGGYTIRSALIQLMACAATKRNLVFYTFGDVSTMFDIDEIFKFLTINQVTIGQLFKLLKKYRFDGDPRDPTKLVPFIIREVTSSQMKKPQPTSEIRPALLRNPTTNKSTSLVQPKLSFKPSTSKEAENDLQSSHLVKLSHAERAKQSFQDIEGTFGDHIKKSQKNDKDKVSESSSSINSNRQKSSEITKEEPKKSFFDCLKDYE